MSLFTTSSKKFTTSFVFISFLFLVSFIGASEWFIRTQLLPNDNFQKYTELFFGNKISEFSLGDSHVAYGFDHPVMLNLGYPSDTISVMKAKLEGLINRSNVTKIIIQADPHLFSSYRIVNNEEFKYSFFKAHTANFNALLVFDEFYKKDLFYMWRTFLKKGKLSNQFPISSNGAQLSQLSLNDMDTTKLLKNTELRANRGLPVARDRQHPLRETYEKMIVLAKSSGAQVCLVSFPVSQIYLDHYDKPGVADVFQFIQNLSDKHQIRYINHQKSYSQRDDFFKDGDHLNAKGARAFSTTTYKDCFL